MADSYVKKLVLDLDINRYKEQAKQAAAIKLIDPKYQKQFTELLAKQKQYNAELETAKQALDDISDFKGPEFNKLRRELKRAMKDAQDSLDELHGTSKKKEDAKEAIVETAKDVGKKVLDLAKRLFSDIWDEAKVMMRDIAAYSGNSSVFSQEATNLKLNYGLSGAQGYAYQMAARQTGFGSFEDYLENFMYADQETLDRFNELLRKYEETYEQDKKIAEQFQKFEAEFSDFKQEVAMEVVDFFMNNRDTIKTFLDVSIKGMEAFIKVAAWIADTFASNRTSTQKDRAISDIVNSYGPQSTINNNVNTNITNNGVDYSRANQVEAVTKAQLRGARMYFQH